MYAVKSGTYEKTVLRLKVLVAYYSMTGNTEKIAEALFEEASIKNEAYLKKVRDITIDSLNDYDLVFLGSACHSTDLAAPAKEMLNLLPNSPRFKLAGFFTHSTFTRESGGSASAYFNEWASRCIVSFEEVAKEKHIDFVGYFNCQGAPSPSIQEFIHNEIIKSDNDWKAYIDEAEKHPNSSDLQRAKEFARKVFSDYYKQHQQ